MKFTKIALVLAASAMALLLVGQSARPPVAKADPEGLLTINWAFCVMLTSTIDWNGDGVVNKADSSQAFLDCAGSMSDQNTFDNMIGALRGIPGPDRVDEIADSPPTQEDFTAPGKDPAGVALTPMDSDAGQLHQEDGRFWVIAFVSNDEPLALYADKGVFLAGGVPLSSHIRCGPPPLTPVPGADFDITDEDCDDDGVKGDGVVVAALIANNASRGDANLRLRQGRLEMDAEYTIVGEPYRIELTAAKKAIQTGAQVCNLFKNTSQYVAALGSPVRSPLTVIVKDSDGTALTGALVLWEIITEESPRPEVARLAQARSPSGQIALTPTVSSALGIASPDVICGDEEPGTVTIRASISRVVPAVLPGDVEAGLDLAARERDVEVEMKVQGPPTEMTLSAAPSSLVCDGTATSAVSATLADAEKNPAIDGNVVRFDVRALGTISPIEAASAGGASTTTVTPLTDIARGVTVNASLLLPALVEDDEDLTAADIADCEATLQYFPCPKLTEVLEPNDLEKAFLVECSSAAPQPAPAGAPGGSTAPNISPPSTGDGGYLTGE